MSTGSKELYELDRRAAQQRTGTAIQLAQRAMAEHVQGANSLRELLEVLKEQHRQMMLEVLPAGRAEKRAHIPKPTSGRHGDRVQVAVACFLEALGDTAPTLEALEGWVRSKRRARGEHAVAVTGYRVFADTGALRILLTTEDPNRPERTFEVTMEEVLVLALYGARVLTEDATEEEYPDYGPLGY